ncbi:HEAT repeat domain-containing protein [Actinacidiphila yanglinensis]|uniref:HEAT repeat domain-containing protein n=1 Tax=Actinacidiphila yanglinensis TaxID=310779 RepID=UPI001F18690A|nr:HEAT repeat domain-containing protein [Actinacidiphila yanglinensis]
MDASAERIAEAARWAAWCGRVVEERRPEDVRLLLARLRGVAADGPPQVRAVVSETLAQAPAVLLPLLDRYAREGRGAGGPVAVSPDLLGRLVASLAPDGRVRQAAVEALAAYGGPLPAAALAVRAADWVPEVSAGAWAALTSRSAPDEAPAVVGVLLGLQARRRAQGLLGEYRSVLAEPAQRRAVRALAAHADPPVRRFGVELALDLGEYVRGDLLRAALYDTDQVCRRLCAQRLLELDPEQAGRLLWARGAGVRELAVSALPADVPATRLVAPLTDRARMVRAQARWKLYQRGEPPADVYRKQLRRAGAKADASPRLLAGLTAGLGECGDPVDVGLLARLLPDPRAAVRRAAVRAVGRLAKPCELVPLLAPLANDPDPGVARHVFEALARVPEEVPPETLWIGRTRTEPAVRRLAERIGVRGAKGYTQSGQSPR